MITWTLILCEGAHDQAAVTSLASVCGAWEWMKGTPKSLPDKLKHAFPKATKGEAEGWIYQPAPKYLRKGDRFLEVRSLGGLEKVFGEPAKSLLGQIYPTAVGVVVDANDAGVDPRLERFQQLYAEYNENVKTAKPGCVCEGTPRLGLWVAPNNKSKGRMEDLLIKAAGRTHKQLVSCGKRFATSLKKIEPGEWTARRNKAILGAIHQVVRPGASLASALQPNQCWFDEDLTKLQPFKALLGFIEELAST